MGVATLGLTPINFASKDLAVLAAGIAAIELQYAYDPERAEEIVTEGMEALGAEMADGTWTYN